MRGYWILILTSRPAAHLRAAGDLLCELGRDLLSNTGRCYREKLAAAHSEHSIARELLLGVAPEKMARDACLRTAGVVEREMFESCLSLAREVGARYGLL